MIPVPGTVLKKDRKIKVLYVCYFDFRGIGTVPQNIAFYQQSSMFSVEVANLYGSADLAMSSSYNLNEYSVVVVHNTVSYNVDSLRSFDKNLPVKLRDYVGVKVILKQDENYRYKEVDKYIAEHGFELVFTCLPEDEIPKVYPLTTRNDVKFVRMFTGYVTPNLRNRTDSTSGDRPLDVGYRGSMQPLSFGRLSFEKWDIGVNFEKHAHKFNLVTDISSKWDDRFGAMEWLEFLARSKATLGVESGASIFDVNDEVDEVVNRFVSEKGGDINDYEFAASVIGRLSEYEGYVYYNQISPRHFEAAATRTLQILYEGDYSGIFKPWRHYVPLKKDFSNIDEVVNAINNESLRAKVCETAYKEVIQNKAYWIETFCSILDDNILESLKRNGTLELSDGKLRALLICGHPPKVDPRIDWVSNFSPSNMIVHVLGLSDAMDGESFTRGAQGGCEFIASRLNDNFSCLDQYELSKNVGFEVFKDLIFLNSLSSQELVKCLGLCKDNEVITNVKDLIRYLLRTTGSLFNAGTIFRDVDCIIAADFDSLIAGCMLKDVFGVPLVYDAHEFWPEQFIGFQYGEYKCFESLECKLLSQVDKAFTVSEHLATYMSSLYRIKFDALPNCMPIEQIEQKHLLPKEKTHKQVCEFLFQGHFSKGRGLEKLIDIWSHVDQKAHLFLRGPDSSYKKTLLKQAKASGLLNERIFFVEPVSEEELVVSASSADVGLIPYEPINLNNKYCCPNKLSQYMCARLPILANDLDYVKEVLLRADCGMSVDFSNNEKLVSVINAYVEDGALRAKHSENAAKFQKNTFNWSVVSVDFYESIFLLVKENNKDRPEKKYQLSINEMSYVGGINSNKVLIFLDGFVEFYRSCSLITRVFLSPFMWLFNYVRRIHLFNKFISVFYR